MTADQAAELIKVLGEKQRFSILIQLLEAPYLPAGTLGSEGMSGPAVSHHLKAMLRCGLLEVSRRKQQRLYSVDVQTLASLARWMAEAAELAELSRLGNYYSELSE